MSELLCAFNDICIHPCRLPLDFLLRLTPEIPIILYVKILTNYALYYKKFISKVKRAAWAKRRNGIGIILLKTMIFFKRMKHLYSGIVNQLVQGINNDSVVVVKADQVRPGIPQKNIVYPSCKIHKFMI